jgi:hypothetical protein
MNIELSYTTEEYVLIDFDQNILSEANLTKLEAQFKNFAFGVNHVNKRYKLKKEFNPKKKDNKPSGSRLILPHS